MGLQIIYKQLEHQKKRSKLADRRAYLLMQQAKKRKINTYKTADNKYNSRKKSINKEYRSTIRNEQKVKSDAWSNMNRGSKFVAMSSIMSAEFGLGLAGITRVKKY